MPSDNDALSLEYKLNYGTARRHFGLADVVDDPAVLRELGILGGGLEEEGFDFLSVAELGSPTR